MREDEEWIVWEVVLVEYGVGSVLVDVVRAYCGAGGGCFWWVDFVVAYFF